MSEPEFFPSHAPHKVEMPEGSNVAKSKSAQVGTDIRRVDKHEQIEGEDLEIHPDNMILLDTGAGAASNIVKLPPQEKKSSKRLRSRPLASLQGQEPVPLRQLRRSKPLRSLKLKKWSRWISPRA